MGTHRPPWQRPRPARASGEGTGQVRGRREPLPWLGALRARAHLVLASGAPPPLGPVGIAVGSRGRQEGGGVGSVRPVCSGPEGLAFRYLHLGASRLPSFGVPGITAAAARQLLLLAVLPTSGLWEVRPCLPHPASALGGLLPWREDWVSGPGPRQGGAMIGTWDRGWESRARGSFGTQTFT